MCQRFAFLLIVQGIPVIFPLWFCPPPCTCSRIVRAQVQFNPQGTRLISASVDRTARIWSIDPPQCIQVLEGHTEEIFSCAYNYEGDVIITGLSAALHAMNCVTPSWHFFFCLRSVLQRQRTTHAAFGRARTARRYQTNDCSSQWCSDRRVWVLSAFLLRKLFSFLPFGEVDVPSVLFSHIWMAGWFPCVQVQVGNGVKLSP